MSEQWEVVPGRLDQFQSHMQSLRNKFEKTDGTIPLIQPQSLTEQDMEMWEEYIQTLKQSIDVLEDLKVNPEQDSTQQAFAALLRLLKKSDPSSLSGKATAREHEIQDAGRAGFYEWLLNRLAGVAMKLELSQRALTGKNIDQVEKVIKDLQNNLLIMRF